MISENPKKMLNIYILEILKKYSDIDHRLKQQDIIDYVQREYGLECERKAVKRNILSLIEFGYDIEYKNGWYMASREFEDSELHLLIDSILFSKSIPTRQAQDLIDKLIKLSSRSFIKKVKHISNLPELQCCDNKQLFYTIDILDEAIGARRKVSFTYNDYYTDKKLHPRRERAYIVNPYQIAATNGRYYLIANYDSHDDISHYRIDHITDIKILEDKVKPQKNVKGLKNGLDLPKHMAENIYMFNGESIKVKMQADKTIINDIIDWFGSKVTFSNETENTCTVSLKINENAIFFWAMQYGEHVKILEPETLQERIKQSADNMAKKYTT